MNYVLKRLGIQAANNNNDYAVSLIIQIYKDIGIAAKKQKLKSILKMIIESIGETVVITLDKKMDNSAQDMIEILETVITIEQTTNENLIHAARILGQIGYKASMQKNEVAVIQSIEILQKLGEIAIEQKIEIDNITPIYAYYKDGEPFCNKYTASMIIIFFETILVHTYENKNREDLTYGIVKRLENIAIAAAEQELEEVALRTVDCLSSTVKVFNPSRNNLVLPQLGIAFILRNIGSKAVEKKSNHLVQRILNELNYMAETAIENNSKNAASIAIEQIGILSLETVEQNLEEAAYVALIILGSLQSKASVQKLDNQADKVKKELEALIEKIETSGCCNNLRTIIELITKIEYDPDKIQEILEEHTKMERNQDI